jgi:hypothetical protein
MPFICSICGEQSTRICARCTKDACDNHLCEKCLRCSDCCECEVTLSEPVRHVVRATVPVEGPVTEPVQAGAETSAETPATELPVAEPQLAEPPAPELSPAEPQLAEPPAAESAPAESPADSQEPELETNLAGEDAYPT